MAAAGHEVHFVTNAALHGSANEKHARQVHREGNLTVHRLAQFDEGRKISPGAMMFGERPAHWRDQTSSWAVDASNIAALLAADYVRNLHAEVGLDVIESPEFFAESYYMIRARRSGRTADFPPVCIHGHTSSRQAYRINSHYWELGSHPHRVMMAREEYCLQQADALLLPSQSLLSIYERDFGKNLPSVRAVVPYFLDLPPEQDLVEMPRGIPQGKPFLLCVGRLEPRKGSDLAVRAFAELGREHPELHLVFLGREMWHHGEHFDDVIATHLPQDLRARVLRLGNVPRDQVLACMREASAFLHPAPWDNYPCATLEAMSAGAVAIVSDQGGQVEMMEPGVSGLLHRSEDAADLVGVIRSVLDGTIDCAAIRRAARARAASVTDASMLLRERQLLWNRLAQPKKASGSTKKGPKGADAPKPVALRGSGTIVIDAGGASVDRFERTRDSVLAFDLPPKKWRVDVLVDPGAGLDLPSGWNAITTHQAPPWATGEKNLSVVWMLAGAEIDTDRLGELVGLASASSGRGGAFAWLRHEGSAAFPWSPDIGSNDVLVVGRPLPAAFAVQAEALRACKSLSGLGSATARLASLIALVASRPAAWLRHTASSIGSFCSEALTVTEDVQLRALGFLDLHRAVDAGVTILGTAQLPQTKEPATPRHQPPVWMPSAPGHPESAAGTKTDSQANAVLSIADLRDRLQASQSDHVWMLRIDNWFDLPAAARLSAETQTKLHIAIDTSEAGLSRLPEIDLVAVYQCIRDWWPELSGPNRPTSLHEEAYNELASQLRSLVRWRAECTLDGLADGTAPLELPPIDHELLAEDAEALRLLRPFFAASESPALASFVGRLLERPDLATQASSLAWVRLVLLHWSWTHHEERSHSLLHGIYAPPEDRSRLIAQEAALCEESGLRWWWDSTWKRLGVESAYGRSAPFSLPPTNGGNRTRTKAVITVLIPSYKHEPYIAEAIRSVLSQTVQNVAVIVVDDRSPDGTAAAARRIADARVSVFENEANKGLGNSILDTLSRVSTPYVAILNSDDIFHPRRLEACLEALQNNASIDLVCTGMHLVDRQGANLDSSSVSAWHDGRNVYDWVHWYERTRPEGGEGSHSFRDLLRRNFLVTSSNIVSRTDWLRAQSKALAGLKYCLDWQLFLTASLRGRLHYVPEPLLAYRLHPSNTVWFDKSARWGYTLEVSRVATDALREHKSLLPDQDQEAAAEVLRDLVQGLRDNTEVDWPGMLVNAIVGGPWLEECSRKNSELASLLKDLLATATPSTHEARRLHALESKTRLQADEMHLLVARQRWSDERIRTTQDEIGSLKERLAAALEEPVQLRETLEATRQQLAIADRRLEELPAERTRLQEALGQAALRISGLEEDAKRLGAQCEAERADNASLRSLLSENLAALAELRTSLENASRRELELSADRSSLAEQAASLRRELEQANAVCEELRATRAELQGETTRLHAEKTRLEDELAALSRAFHAKDAKHGEERRNFQRGWDAAAALRAALALDRAEEIARAAREESKTWTWRGFRVRPGGTTRNLVRRLIKGARKLGPRIIYGPGADSRTRFALVYFPEPGSDLSTTGVGPKFHGHTVLPMHPADGNAEIPAVRPGTALYLTFPEHGPKLLRRIASHRKSDSERLVSRLHGLAESMHREPTATITETAHAAAQIRSRPGAVVLTSGSLAWQASMGLAAELAGRPWIAVVDRVAAADLKVLASAAWALAGARLVIARSQKIADLLIEARVSAANIVVDPVEPATGLFTGGQAPGLTVAFGDFESPWIWDHCISAFLMAAQPGQKLHIVGSVRTDNPASLAAEFLALKMAQRDPERVTVHSYDVRQDDWHRILATDAPKALVWVPPGEQCTSAPHPAVLAAMKQEIPILPVDCPTATAVLGSLGLRTWIRRTGVLETADMFRTHCAGEGISEFDRSMIRTALLSVLDPRARQAAGDRIRAVLQEALEQ